ncbi:hypothetical protein TRAPUB_11752 [Trametes pubescens]|uniref:Uncharacterized protein n=1 Tax=Trametes pubescens TaxID=154538 RepID=A0A1M2VVY5_TRAPU|nr:hypothetical protein TRAPUB_136 [Trametes pubescens]OJT11728.1 hypothetical protein TRAPUB_11752 [Trametes pubescens]
MRPEVERQTQVRKESATRRHRVLHAPLVPYCPIQPAYTSSTRFDLFTDRSSARLASVLGQVSGITQDPFTELPPRGAVLLRVSQRTAARLTATIHRLEPEA